MVTKKYLISGLIILLTGSSFLVMQNIERLYARILSRQVQDGKSITLQSEIFYQENGDLVTHFISPKEYIIISNKLGEIKLYDPVNNTVFTKQNNLFSSQTSQIYYFLSGKSSDMGLNELGFIPVKTYPENNLIVSEWKRKTSDPKSEIQKIKLVHQLQNPIYMDYRDKNNKIIRKVYYYGYRKLYQYSFPSTTTEIIYNSTTDSAVTKTIYNDFRINSDAANNYFGFKIPSTAHKINE